MGTKLHLGMVITITTKLRLGMEIIITTTKPRLEMEIIITTTKPRLEMEIITTKIHLGMETTTTKPHLGILDKNKDNKSKPFGQTNQKPTNTGFGKNAGQINFGASKPNQN